MFLSISKLLGIINIFIYLVSFSYVLYVEKTHGYEDEYGAAGVMAIGIFFALIFGYLPTKIMCLIHDDQYLKKLLMRHSLEKIESLKLFISVLSPASMILSLLMFFIFFVPKGLEHIRVITN